MLALRTSLVQVWIILVVATLFSVMLGESSFRSESVFAHDALVAGVIAVAALKFWLVMDYFMEAHQGPRRLRVIAAVWLFGWTALIVSFYPLALW